MVKMMFQKTPPCERCGKEKIIVPFSAVPPMVGFELNDGRILNICSDCLVEIGMMEDEEQKKIFSDMGIDVDDYNEEYTS